MDVTLGNAVVAVRKCYGTSYQQNPNRLAAHIACLAPEAEPEAHEVTTCDRPEVMNSSIKHGSIQHQ